MEKSDDVPNFLERSRQKSTKKSPEYHPVAEKRGWRKRPFSIQPFASQCCKRRAMLVGCPPHIPPRKQEGYLTAGSGASSAQQEGGISSSPRREGFMKVTVGRPRDLPPTYDHRLFVVQSPRSKVDMCVHTCMECTTATGTIMDSTNYFSALHHTVGVTAASPLSKEANGCDLLQTQQRQSAA